MKQVQAATRCVELEGDWYDIPDTARYVTQDKSGWWYWYVWLPILITHPIYSRWKRAAGTGIRCGFIANKTPPEDWTQELYELVD